MKTTGVSCVPKFGLLLCFGTPEVHWCTLMCTDVHLPGQQVKPIDQRHQSQRARAPAWTKPRHLFKIQKLRRIFSSLTFQKLKIFCPEIWTPCSRETPTKHESTGWRSTLPLTRSPSNITRSSRNSRVSVLTGDSTIPLPPLSVPFSNRIFRIFCHPCQIHS